MTDEELLLARHQEELHIEWLLEEQAREQQYRVFSNTTDKIALLKELKTTLKQYRKKMLALNRIDFSSIFQPIDAEKNILLLVKELSKDITFLERYLEDDG